MAEQRSEQAVAWFLRMRSEETRGADLLELQRWMESDPRNATAYQEAAATWDTLGAHASAPEIILRRRDALAHSHQAGRRRGSAPSGLRLRWATAACLLLTSLAGVGWLMAERAGVYATARGERRTVTLEDGSVVTLDAQSRVRARYTDGERRVILERGQARFVVAKDPLRPFRVQAREQTVVALGTQFDVELVSGAVLVTLIDGRVAVAGVDAQSLAPTNTSGGARPSADARRYGASAQLVELQVGQELRVRQDGHATLQAHVDLEHVSGWQTGKLYFNNEPLVDAAARINRYARRAVMVDPSVAQLRISGIFNAGDAAAFVEGVTAYLPVQVGNSTDTEVQLTARR